MDSLDIDEIENIIQEDENEKLENIENEQFTNDSLYQQTNYQQQSLQSNFIQSQNSDNQQYNPAGYDSEDSNKIIQMKFQQKNQNENLKKKENESILQNQIQNQELLQKYGKEKYEDIMKIIREPSENNSDDEMIKEMIQQDEFKRNLQKDSQMEKMKKLQQWGKIDYKWKIPQSEISVDKPKQEIKTSQNRINNNVNNINKAINFNQQNKIQQKSQKIEQNRQNNDFDINDIEDIQPLDESSIKQLFQKNFVMPLKKNLNSQKPSKQKSISSQQFSNLGSKKKAENFTNTDQNTQNTGSKTKSFVDSQQNDQNFQNLKETFDELKRLQQEGLELNQEQMQILNSVQDYEGLIEDQNNFINQNRNQETEKNESDEHENMSVESQVENENQDTDNQLNVKQTSDNKNKNQNKQKNENTQEEDEQSILELLKQKQDKKKVKMKPELLKLNNRKIQNQFCIHILGIDIYFPYQPYPQQVDYMKSVIQALQGQKNALLQSPTGTGKTLCLICACMGWLVKKREEQVKNKEDNAVKIIYSSRTHSQLQQVVKELKKTVYKPKTCVMASRDQLCINKSLNYISGYVKNGKCRKLCKEGNCSYNNGMKQNKRNLMTQFKNNQDILMKNNYYSLQEQNEGNQQNMHLSENINESEENRESTDQELIDENNVAEKINDRLKNQFFMQNNIMDIEDLKEKGKEENFCPYYYTQFSKEFSDIVLMPYNYLLNPNKMPKFQIDLENAVVIFDEAHNVAEVSEDGFSFQLEDLYLESAIEELNTLKNVMKRNDILMAIDFTQQLQEMMGKLANGKNFIKKMNCQKNFYHFNPKKINQKKVRKSIQTTMKEENKQQSLMSFGFNVVKGQKSEEKNEQNLNLKNFNKIVNIFNEAQIYLMMSKDWGVDNVLMFLSGVRNLMSNDEQFQDNKQKKSTQNTVTHFKLVFKKDLEKQNNQLQMMCLDPSLSFKKIIQKNPYNIMLTSGTLTPFNFWDEELKIDFDIKLSGKHVIDTKNNLSAGIVHRGPSGIEFDFSFRNRENDQMFIDLGLLIKDLSSQIPGGILVIFSSYSIRDKCKQLWLKKDIYMKINAIKQIMIEMNSNEESKSIMNSYKQKCITKDGAILLAVSKGKLSEGYDFPDDLCRAVVMVGIPFPPIMETKVEQKRKYLDEISGKIRGQDWYMMQAMRATNQALGRVVRHKEDFGQILMLDSRFRRADLKNQISGWIRENLKSWYSSAEVVRESQNFFKNQEILQIQRMEEIGQQRQLQQVLERDQVLIQVQRAKRLGMDEEKEIQKPVEQLKDTEKPVIQNEQASEIEKMKLADRIQLIMEFNKIKNSDKKVGSNASRLLEIQQQQESEKKLKEEQEQQQQCNNIQNPQEDQQQIQQTQQKKNIEYLPTIFKKQQERMEQLKKEQEEFFKQKMEEQKRNYQQQNKIENKNNNHQNLFNLTQGQNFNQNNQNQIFSQQQNLQNNQQNPLQLENFTQDVVIKPPVSTIQNFNNQGIDLKNLDQQQKVDISNSLYKIMNNEDLAWKNVQDQNLVYKQKLQNREQQDEQLQNNQLFFQQQKLQDRNNNNNASKLIKKTFKFHFQQDESMPSSQNTTNHKQNQQQNFDLFSKKGTKRKNSLQEENLQNSNDNFNYKKNKTPDKNSYLDGQFENQKKVLNFDDLKKGVTQEGKIRLLNQNKLDQAMKITFGDYQNQELG